MSRTPVVVVAAASANGAEPPGATIAIVLRGVRRGDVDCGGCFTAILARLMNGVPRSDPAVALRPMLVVAPLQRRSVMIDRHELLAKKQRVASAIRNIRHAHGLPGDGAGVIPTRDDGAVPSR